MLNVCDQGVNIFYLFAPGWNDQSTGQNIRTSNCHLIHDFNKIFHARTPRRNRIYRFGV